MTQKEIKEVLDRETEAFRQRRETELQNSVVGPIRAHGHETGMSDERRDQYYRDLEELNQRAAEAARLKERQQLQAIGNVELQVDWDKVYANLRRGE